MGSFVTIVMTVVVAAATGAAAYLWVTSRARRAEEESSLRDAMTGLPNRRGILRVLSSEVAIPGATGILLLVDVDNFRRVNAERGIEAGDAALRHLLERVQRILRADQPVGRWSSDTFMVLLPGAQVDDGAATAERIRSVIEQTAWEWEEREVVLTATVAIARWQAGEDCDALLRSVEQAMLEGKHRGRNRVSPAAGLKLPTHAAPGAGTPTPRSTVARSVIR
jgi:diguanylate cyclase